MKNLQVCFAYGMAFFLMFMIYQKVSIDATYAKGTSTGGKVWLDFLPKP